jgi:CheY-like chemotaxis protein
MELRVFLVEDLQSMHSLLHDVFDAIGAVVAATVRTEAEALLWLTEHPGQWDLAVIDLVLDQGAGMSVIRRCKSEPLAGKVVVFSSYASPGVRKHCEELGADAVFDKNDPQAFINWCADLTSQENSGP